MKDTDLEIDLIRAFIAVAETRNFTQAALRLHRTQSATSMRIKKLEAQLGCKLFERTTVSVTLTSLGERFLSVAYRLIEVNEQAFFALNAASTQGKVVLATSETYASCLLPPLLQVMADTFPNVEIELRCGHSWTLLETMDDLCIDLVIATRNPKRTQGTPLRRERLLWVTDEMSQVHLDAPLPLAMFPTGCVYRDHALAALNASGRSWRMAYTCFNHEALLAAVASGLAVTVLIESAVPEYLRLLEHEGGLTRLPSVDIDLYRNPSRSNVLLGPVYELICGHFNNGLEPQVSAV
ncbi:LysR family transcriptional regulator [Pseudomonas sp. L1(2025)]|uniref:LysR family transcriptional regulator n=1 Tax=Pseudomonas sp. L1(2025) TaxID=3449429 RepID=UPI003F692925